MTRGDRRDDAVVYRKDPPVLSEEVNELFACAWGGNGARDWSLVLRRSLVYLCVYWEGRLVGFVNVAWDGGVHNFILDTTVHPKVRRRGIWRGLVTRAVVESRRRNVEWLHVDFEPRLRSIYDLCGFRSTGAGLLYLGAENASPRA